MESVIFLIIAIAFAVMYLTVASRNKNLNTKVDELSKRFCGMELAHACAADNLNFMQNCLAKFASKIYKRPIPTYSDGQQWRPGDIVDFTTVLGDCKYTGEISVFLDDEGMMLDRCPMCIEQLNSSDERYFTIGQVKDVTLKKRPELFMEIVSKQKKED